MYTRAHTTVLGDTRADVLRRHSTPETYPSTWTSETGIRGSEIHPYLYPTPTVPSLRFRRPGA